MKNFTIFTQGPDNNSTYAECWGANSPSKGRHIADCDTVDEVIEAIHDLGHTNYTVRDRRRHETYCGPAIKTLKDLK